MASTMDEFRAQVKAAQEKFDATLKTVDKRALDGQVGVTSPCGSVRVEVGGDLRVRKVAVKPGVLNELDATDLDELITQTYNQALAVMQKAQWKLIRATFRASHNKSEEER